jgi:hypothetical protein
MREGLVVTNRYEQNARHGHRGTRHNRPDTEGQVQSSPIADGNTVYAKKIPASRELVKVSYKMIVPSFPF